MSLSDAFFVVVRWLHLLSAAAWVGGGIFYLLVLRPTLRRSPEGSRLVNAAAASEFRALVETCVYVLIATGVILTLHRLTPGVVGLPYVVTLGVKIALSVWMFALAWSRRKRTSITEAFREEAPPPTTRLRKTLRAVSGYNTIVILGLAVFLLSDILKTLYELALR
ncbi:MAG: hypothetical protein F4X57_09040 [Chloroflexi bacterium]|nr:hypothetical protein [Chloroflexota bacterium]